MLRVPGAALCHSSACFDRIVVLASCVGQALPEAPHVRPFCSPERKNRLKATARRAYRGIETAIRQFLRSKIHKATVTEANIEYEGSVTIDRDLLEAADILPYERVHIWDCTNGARLSTYAIEGERGSGEVCINGAAAHLVKPLDVVIIASFVQLEDAEARAFEARRVFVDHRNRIRE